MESSQNNPRDSRKPGGRSRVFVVEDHPIVREGLTLLIGADPQLMICGTKDTMEDAVPTILDATPDVVVIDITLGDGNGLELIRSLHRHKPRLPILVLSMHHEDLQAERACARGPRVM